ncbi:MAG: hypothetical protein A3B70_02790 [Deltaproteobacteria bacterium RIFCSPHIGHO2_02_FULL_40_11]|nr:MAG: hypothetical protein A3B70_02790 [Deltaproteobacteria bacterium RIFCSPHIGHO2_02_FULL_40_11]
MRFVLILTLFWILALSAGMTNSFAGENWTYKWLPEEKYVFPAMIADPWETQCWISFNHNYKQYGKIGTRVPLYQAKLQVDPPLSRGMTASEIVQLGVDLLVFESMRYRKAEGGGFDLDTADTKFGAHLEWDLNGDWFFRFLAGHISAHLADGLLNDKTKQSYSREYLQWAVAKKYTYFTPYFSFHNIFSQRHPKEYEGQNFFIFQWGGEAFLPLVSDKVSLFVAGDFQSREEYSWNVNQAYMTGFRFNGTHAEPFRLLFHYYRGFDPRGEFYNEKVEVWGFGLQRAI